MIRRLHIYSVSLAFLSAGATPAEESVRQLLSLMFLKGDCIELVAEGQQLSCAGLLGHTEYDDGRIAFQFIATLPDGPIVSFSGDGRRQRAPSENTRIQHIDGIISADSTIYGTGECFFENPYAGPARIECEATSEDGARFSGKFLSDGAEPRVARVGESDQ